MGRRAKRRLEPPRRENISKGMKTSASRRLVCWSLLAGLCATLLPGTACGASTVYLKTGKSLAVDTIQWKDGNKEYQVVTTEGAVQMTIPQKDVDRLDVERPAEFDRADKLIAGGQTEAAIPILEGIAAKFKMLVWDVRAREALGRIYVQKKDSSKALAALEPLFSSDVSARVAPDARRLYWQALLAAGRTVDLQKKLDETIAFGRRDAAAAAQVMRGDLFRAAGKKEEALSDYLRTVLFFEDAKDVRPEALFKAAEGLNELGDPRAQEYRRILVQKYPESEFAKKVAGKTE